MFSGVSYASMVKVKTQQKPTSLNQAIISKMKPKTNSNEAQTSDISAKNRANITSIAPFTKSSDVASKFKIKNECRANSCNVFTPSNHDAILLHSRLSCDLHMKSHSENTDIFADQVNKNI